MTAKLAPSWLVLLLLALPSARAFAVDVTGTVEAFALDPSPSFNLPFTSSLDVSGPYPVKYARVIVNDDPNLTAETDQNGNFVISTTFAPTVVVTVKVSLVRDASPTHPTFEVTNDAGAELELSLTQAAGTPFQFTAAAGEAFNMSKTEFDTAQISAFLYMGHIVDFFQANYTGTTPVAKVFVRVNYNGTGPCDVNLGGAQHSNNEISLSRSRTCPGQVPSLLNNLAYSTPVYHEYMHIWLGDLVSGSPSSCEAFADLVTIYYTGDPVVGRDLFGPGTFRRDHRQDWIHPAPPEGVDQHYPGRPFESSMWEIREELIEAESTTGEGASIANELLFETLRLQEVRGSLPPPFEILVADVLQADTNLFASAHHDMITAAFARHNLPEVAGTTEYVGCEFPEPGWGGALDCDENAVPPEGYDPLSNTQWQWDAACVWQAWEVEGDYKRGRQGVRVALSEATRCNFAHEDLQANFYKFRDWSFPPFGAWVHSTHASGVLGVVGADDNGVGVMGVAPDVLVSLTRLMNTFPEHGQDTANVYWAANQRHRVLNISFGLYKKSEALVRAVRKASTEAWLGKGMLITIAGGNTDAQIPFYHLSSHPLVTAVGALRLSEAGSMEHDCETVFGEALDIVAPNHKGFPLSNSATTNRLYTGVGFSSPDSYVCFDDTSVAVLGGTSFCGPFVAGVAALMFSRDDSLTRDEVAQILYHSTNTTFSTYIHRYKLNVPCYPPDNDGVDPVTRHSPSWGHGRVDAKAAVEFVERGTRWPEPVAHFSAEPEPDGGGLSVRLRWQNPSRNFTGVVVIKSVDDQRVLYAPPDSEDLPPEVDDPVAGGAGTVIHVGDGSTFLDTDATPTGLRRYSIFAFYESSEDGDIATSGVQAETWTRYSFGREASMRLGTLFTVDSQSSLSSVLSSQNLEGGDVVLLEEGAHELDTTLVWGGVDPMGNPFDSGDPMNGHVYLMGRTPPTRIGLTTSGAFVVPAPGFSGEEAIRIEGHSVTLRHVGFSGFTSGSAIHVAAGDGTVRVVSNRITDCATGVVLDGALSKILVQNNIVESATVGVHCKTAPTLLPGGYGGRYSIQNNTILVDNGIGVDVDFDPNSCRSTDCSGGTYFQTLGPSVALYNNILAVSAGSSWCLDIADANSWPLSNNNCFVSVSSNVVRMAGEPFTLDDWVERAWCDQDSIAGDPQFVDDYSLESQSPCINRGQAFDLEDLDFLDQVGGSRIVGGLIDIGADEADTPDLGGRFKRGDANSDGKINISDGQFMTNFLFRGGPPPACDDAADVNDDEVLDISDVTLLLKALFLIDDPTTFEAGTPVWIRFPYDDCGVDPYGFELFCSTDVCTS